ncbi:MAG TPA: RNA polymerase sigma factor [Candidatus Paceibacterota bacterium]|nr:RNA polymerase sigma factor [Candidatus Paceibacterota bacterium]
MDRTDEELIALYLAGNEAAFGELTARHLRQIYSYALRLVGDAAAAEDISQETFLKAWKSLKKYDEKSSKFKTWLLRIARNTAIDYLRKKKHVPLSYFESDTGGNVLAETIADPEELAPQMLERLDDARELHETLANLSPKHREILLLYYTNDATFEEIAEALNEPTNTVKSRHRRALAALKALIAPNGANGTYN